MLEHIHMKVSYNRSNPPKTRTLHASTLTLHIDALLRFIPTKILINSATVHTISHKVHDTHIHTYMYTQHTHAYMQKINIHT